MNRRPMVCGLALLGVLWLPACSTQQAYGAVQAWQRNACVKLADVQERRRCMESSSTSYGDYQREAEAAQGAR